PLRFAARRCKTPHTGTTRGRSVGIVSATPAPSAQRTCETVQCRRPTLACLWLADRVDQGRGVAGECSPPTATAAAERAQAARGPGEGRPRGLTPTHRATSEP